MNATAPDIRRLGLEASTERQVYLVSVPTLADLPATFDLVDRRFVLLLLADFSDPSQDLSIAAKRIVDAGCSYFCAWGPGCELIHNAVDDAAEIPVPDDGQSVLMTTDHADDSINDAVFFAVVTAMPVGTYANGCTATILLVVNNARWLRDVESAAKDYLVKHAI